jgi:signal transduction histidine kinase
MKRTLLTTTIRFENDVVLVRQRARQIAELVGFDRQEQTRIVTAVSEIARNAFEYAQGGKVEFYFEDEFPAQFMICVKDSGPGIRDLESILSGNYVSKTGLGKGVKGARRLMEIFSVETTSSGSTVTLGKPLPLKTNLSPTLILKIVSALTKFAPENAFEEVRSQNQELLQALESLQLREAELHSERDMRERFVAALTHDLRTPLTAIKMNADLLLRQTGLTEAVTRKATRIQKSVARADQMILNLLDASRIRAGEPLPLVLKECSLRKIIHEQIEDQAEIHGRDRLILDLPDDDIAGVWDGSALRRVLDNLIGNAFKYGSETSPVTLSVHAEQGQVRLCVSNEGFPLSSDDQKTLFNPYRRSASALTGGKKGWGIGLTLVKGMIEAHGGSVSVSSGETEGTRFTLCFPVQPVPQI